ncbi:DUF2510 domain-containing protein [Agrococcus sp. SCSIO52902]|uniref:DUF2510 domain-containing protein n=1 Tax=Agrococcus sp. SCSIO52902 TaxID=2933290 RepID=UPI001FF5A90C|nr:DUF2510 domain-containing protein [Agrococcus sp. SCSIO52902]UOW01431.1 DUF2510 domain-containing protein [Agrococcus sp. SCSIO52902]
MPSFLIVHSVIQDGRFDAYRQPPTLDIGGLRAPLDWGDITLHVPAGDLPVTVYVVRTDGQIEGAKITVRAPAGTGTRLTFIPPLQPGGTSQLRIDGQWAADSSMHYYAARDARVLAAPTHPLPPVGEGRSRAASGVRIVAPAAAPLAPPAQAVGPTPGSTASVPPSPSSFGHEQGARVDPVQASPAHPAPGAAGPAQPQPSFGQRQPPAIPTPEEFDRLEREAGAAQARAYEAWAAQQRATSHEQLAQHDGAPRPIGLVPANAGQAQPAWYPDPFRRAELRWFDGQQWTSSVMRGGARAHDLPG